MGGVDTRRRVERSASPRGRARDGQYPGVRGRRWVVGRESDNSSVGAWMELNGRGRDVRKTTREGATVCGRGEEAGGSGPRVALLARPALGDACFREVAGSGILRNAGMEEASLRWRERAEERAEERDTEAR
jgi:hypothetical protein